MKYFTKEWCFGDLDDEVVEKAVNDYSSYIDAIYCNLPYVLKFLVKSINFHDGIIKKVSLNRKVMVLSIEGTFGNLQTGYFILSIEYRKVSNINDLVSAFKNEKFVILADEIEFLENGCFAHRLIFSSKKDVEILFNDIGISIRNAYAMDHKIENCQCHLLD